MSLSKSAQLLFRTRQVFQYCRNFSITVRNNVSESERNFEEIRIPLPFGHIAGKWWGPQDKRPILCLHGWQESCGSFDPLISHLPKDIGFLAIDYPGHGHSSRLPRGLYYHGIDTAILLRRLQLYFNWPQLSLLGHSMGSITSFMFAGLYPKNVDMVIGIDALKPKTRTASDAMDTAVKYIEKFLRYELLGNRNSKPPEYTMDEIVNRIHVASHKSIARDKCKYVLNRTIEQSSIDPNKYYFTRDNRLKLGPLTSMHQSDMLEFARRVSCPMVFMKATKSSYFEDKNLFYEVVDVLKKSNKDFEYLYVEGTHHVHLNEPEKVANIINRFLEKYNHVDRSIGGIKNEIRMKN